MAKRRHHRRRRSNPHRAHRRRRSFLLAPRRSHNPFHRRRRRYHNPRFGGFTTTDLLYMGGGALVNGILTRSVPQMLVPQYNTGMVGYALNVGTGALGAWAIGRFNRRAGQGAWIGMIVAVGQRIIAEQFGGGGAAATGGMSGDLDFDLGYYASERFPFPQGSGGPYDRFPGTPYLAPGALPTAASAVHAGRAAAAAALPAAAAPAATAANGGAQADRWSAAWS